MPVILRRPATVLHATALVARSSIPTAFPSEPVTARLGRAALAAMSSTVSALNRVVPVWRATVPVPSTSSVARGARNRAAGRPAIASRLLRGASAEASRTRSARSDGRPPVHAEPEPGHEQLPVRGVAADVGVVGQERRAVARAGHAHVTGTADRPAAAQDRPTALLPGPEERLRARHAGGVGAVAAAAVPGRVEEVDEAAMAQERGRLDVAPLPRGARAEQLARRGGQRHSARRERRGEDRRRPPAAVAVALPDEPRAALLVRDRERVDLARCGCTRSARGRGTGRAIRAADAPATQRRPFLAERGVVGEEAAVAAHQLGRPEVVPRPAWAPRQHRADLPPVHEVARVEHREGRQPVVRGRRGVPAARRPEDRGIRVVAAPRPGSPPRAGAHAPASTAASARDRSRKPP